MQVKKQQLEPDMEQWTGLKWGKEYDKAIYCHPAYLTCMKSTSCGIQDWMSHKLESRLPGEIPTTLDMQMIPLLMAENEEELKSLLMSVKEESEKNWLETQHSKNLRLWHPVPSLHGKFSSVAQSCPNSLRYHGLQHARPPCPSPTPRVYLNLCPLSQ